MRRIIVRTGTSYKFDFFTFQVVSRSQKSVKDIMHIGVHTGTEFHRFGHPDEFWAWCQALPKGRWYGYSADAIPDLCALLPNPLFDLKDYLDCGSKFISGRLGRVTVVDAQNILHVPEDTRDEVLRAIARRYAMDHLEPVKADAGLAVLEKLQQDTRLLWEALFRFFEDMRQYIDPRPLTLGSNSLRVWQQNFCPLATAHPKGLEIMVSDLDDSFRPAYFGGRSEVFSRGRQEAITCYDVRSMYPSAMMMAYPVPGELQHASARKLSQGQFLDMLASCEGMMRGVATVPENFRYGTLPVRELRHEGKVVFPVGQFEGAWCFPEVREHIRRGGGFFFLEAVYSEARCYPFRDFVQEFWLLREASTDKWERHQQKLLMNTLYGKLSQAGLPTEKFLRSPQKDGKGRLLDPQGIIQARSEWQWIPFDADDDGPGCWRKENESAHAYNSILCLGAYTTSQARVQHLRGLEASRAVYGDTDSAFAWDMPPELLSEDLGAWRVDKRYAWADFRTPKTYQAELYDGTLIQRCKGVPRLYVPRLFEALESREAGFPMRRLRTPREAVGQDSLAGQSMLMWRRIPLSDDKRCWKGVDSMPHKYAILKKENRQVCGC